MLYLFLTLFFSLFVAFFAVQNAMPVSIAFFTWQWQTSLVLVILGSAIVGALAVLSAAIPYQIKANWALKRSRQQQGELEAEIRTLKERLDKEAVKAANIP